VIRWIGGSRTEPSMFYTYVLKSKTSGNLYTGYTSDLRKRFKEHCDGKSRYTKGRGPFEIIYYEACVNEADAKNRELYLKSGRGKLYLKGRLKRFLFCTG
jgi:putative endonuclease